MTKVKPHSGPLTRAEHAYRSYCLDIEPGVTLADLLRPEMWSRNTDGQLRPGDVVRVRSDTEGFDLPLLVMSILPGAGVIMRVHEEVIPGTPGYQRLKAIEAAVKAEQLAAKQAEIDAAIGGRP